MNIQPERNAGLALGHILAQILLCRTPIAVSSGSWDLVSSIQLAKILPELGVDLVDVSSGGNHQDQNIQPHGNYQIDLAHVLTKSEKQFKHLSSRTGDLSGCCWVDSGS